MFIQLSSGEVINTAHIVSMKLPDTGKGEIVVAGYSDPITLSEADVKKLVNTLVTNRILRK